MAEHADDGVPANGLPAAEAIERERGRWDEGQTVRERLYETALTLRSQNRSLHATEPANTFPVWIWRSATSKATNDW